MALSHPFMHNDAVYPDAYSRVTLIHLGSKGGMFFVDTHEDLAARERLDPPLRTQMFQVTPSQLVGDTYKLAYDHLKTQPGFEEAITYPDGDDVKPPAAAPAPAAG